LNSINSDASIFGLYGTCPSEHAASLAEALSTEAANMTENISEEELARAKNQLRAAVFAQSESRAFLLEDIGKQTLIFDKVRSPLDISERIDKVTQDDVRKVVSFFSFFIVFLTHLAFFVAFRLPRCCLVLLLWQLLVI
jgi:predicted Zn-dependent peptidase